MSRYVYELKQASYVKETKYLEVIVWNDVKDKDILRHLRNCYAKSNSIFRAPSELHYQVTYRQV